MTEKPGILSEEGLKAILDYTGGLGGLRSFFSTSWKIHRQLRDFSSLPPHLQQRVREIVGREDIDRRPLDERELERVQAELVESELKFKWMQRGL